MNLYIYCRQDSLTSDQMTVLKRRFSHVEILDRPDYALLFNDEEPINNVN